MYTITDAAGLYTYYDNVDIIYAMEITGEDSVLVIESPLVYVENDITFKNLQGNAVADVAKSLVTKIRTADPENVTVNGILLGTFTDMEATEILGDGDVRNVFYFNGIPGIIARGADGGTYAYRSYDMEKLSETNLANWDVSGGSYGENSITPAANVRFESGTVYRIFGAGQGTTMDATLVLDGGAAGNSTYGGAVENGTVLKVTVVYECGSSKRNAYVGGQAGSVVGDINKVYGEDEYSAEVWVFDYYGTYTYLGGYECNVYGNLKFEQYGGSLLYLLSGSRKDAVHYGDVDITVYGGMWESAFRQLISHHGNARLKIYEGMLGVGADEYPTIQKENDAEYKLSVIETRSWILLRMPESWLSDSLKIRFLMVLKREL